MKIFWPIENFLLYGISTRHITMALLVYSTFDGGRSSVSGDSVSS